MNFWQIFQVFEKPERERGGDSAARRLFRALSGSAGLRRPRRAIGASASLRLESLEVRQVLSSISPVPQDLNSQELPRPPVESDAAEMPDSGMSDVARVVNSFRGQLSAAIVSFQPVQTSKVAEVSGDQAMSLATVSDGVPQLTATVGHCSSTDQRPGCPGLGQKRSASYGRRLVGRRYCRHCAGPRQQLTCSIGCCGCRRPDFIQYD